MKPMIILAKFKGANGSLGYVTGNEYVLNFRAVEKVVISHAHAPQPKPCVYGSLLSFLKNWEVLA